MDSHRFDEVLKDIVHDTKTISNFLETIFGFLCRYTDFYHVQSHEKDVIGFPPGVKEQIVLKALQKFDPKYRNGYIQDEVPPVEKEVEVVTEENNILTDSRESAELAETDDFFTSTEYINGACFQTYCWSQTSTEIELYIRLPENSKSAKSLNISVEAKRIQIVSKSNTQPEVILEGNLINKCKQNEVLWTISEEGKLQLTLDKVTEAWWDRLFVEEPPIDISTISNTKYLDELPPESQAAVEKLRWEQLQKETQAGNVLHEQRNIELLRRGWDAEGSPFKGQPFDPTLVSFN